MRYTVYKTTNTVNGKFYVGAHSTEDPNDDYLGSGSLLQKAIRKYGKGAFTKEVLHDFDTPEEMFAKEREIVTPEFKNDPGNYNLREGGEGGWGHIHTSRTTAEYREMSRKGLLERRRLWKEDPEWSARRREQQKQVVQGVWKGRSHTEETKAKMSAAARVSSLGARNSQYGTAWVFREGEGAKKIPKAELVAHLEDGWSRGRGGRDPYKPPTGKQRARLDWPQVREIRRLHGEGVSQTRLAKQFNVTQANVSLIVRGKTWVEK